MTISKTRLYIITPQSAIQIAKIAYSIILSKLYTDKNKCIAVKSRCYTKVYFEWNLSKTAYSRWIPLLISKLGIYTTILYSMLYYTILYNLFYYTTTPTFFAKTHKNLGVVA